MSNNLSQLANDRYEIADALHRYAFGLDHADADALGSAFTDDCVFDFRPAGKKTGLDFPVLHGRAEIVGALFPLLGPLDTSHTTSNFQIQVNGDAATMDACVMAQHFMPHEGSHRGSENALLMNRYDCELLRDGEKWRFTRVVIDNAWVQGDPQILKALATRLALRTKPKSK